MVEPVDFSLMSTADLLAVTRAQVKSWTPAQQSRYLAELAVRALNQNVLTEKPETKAE